MVGCLSVQGLRVRKKVRGRVCVATEGHTGDQEPEKAREERDGLGVINTALAALLSGHSWA